jgi:hypothetical protein
MFSFSFLAAMMQIMQCFTKKTILPGVISYIEASDFNISAANKHETENGAKACNRTRHEKPKLATEGKAKTANQVAAHYHTNDRTRDHHHS